MKPGRNDPCPCGSGKKFKHCCLAAESQARETPEQLTWQRVRRANDGFPAAMLRFVAEVYGPEVFDEAWGEFTLWDEEEFDPESHHGPLFLPWMYHCWAPDPLEETSVADASLHGRTPTSVYLERRAARLDPLQRRYLEACLDAPLSFHEIVRSVPGHGFRARDLITGEEQEVLERSASRSMGAGDILFGQLVPIDGIVMLEACPLFGIPPMGKIAVIDLRDRITQSRSGDRFSRGLLREWDFELRELYLDLIDPVVNPPVPELHNTDGDPVVLQRAIFEIDSIQAAFDALKHLAHGDSEQELLASAERDANGTLARMQLDWTKPGNRVHKSWDNTIFGRLEFTADRLVANVNSDERAAAFRRIVEQRLGNRARYVGSEMVTEMEPSTEDTAAAEEERARLAELPEIKEQMNRMLLAHYESWPTTEVPALGNRRPVDAVRDPQGRERVAALVQQIERDGRRMNPPLDSAIVTRLRERLGLAAEPQPPG